LIKSRNLYNFTGCVSFHR